MKHPSIDDVELTDIMHALSDPARLEIVASLSRAKHALTCGELAVHRPKSSMSHHFKILRGAGLVQTSIEGKEHLNSLRLSEIEGKFPGLLKSVLKVINSG